MEKERGRAKGRQDEGKDWAPSGPVGGVAVCGGGSGSKRWLEQ